MDQAHDARRIAGFEANLRADAKGLATGDIRDYLSEIDDMEILRGLAVGSRIESVTSRPFGSLGH